MKMSHERTSLGSSGKKTISVGNRIFHTGHLGLVLSSEFQVTQYRVFCLLHPKC